MPKERVRVRGAVQCAEAACAGKRSIVAGAWSVGSMGQ